MKKKNKLVLEIGMDLIDETGKETVNGIEKNLDETWKIL